MLKYQAQSFKKHVYFMNLRNIKLFTEAGWIPIFLDMLLLLICFFVMIFASINNDLYKEESFSSVKMGEGNGIIKPIETYDQGLKLVYKSIHNFIEDNSLREILLAKLYNEELRIYIAPKILHSIKDIEQAKNNEIIKLLITLIYNNLGDNYNLYITNYIRAGNLTENINEAVNFAFMLQKVGLHHSLMIENLELKSSNEEIFMKNHNNFISFNIGVKK